MPLIPNHALLHNAALVARTRRQHHSTRRICHWMDNIVEDSLMSDPYIADDEDDSSRVTGRRSEIFVCTPTRGSKMELQFHSHSRFSKETHDAAHDDVHDRAHESDSSDSGPTFSDVESSPVYRKSRNPHNLTVKIHRSPYKTRYTIDREARAQRALTPRTPRIKKTKNRSPRTPKSPYHQAYRVGSAPYAASKPDPSGILAQEAEAAIDRYMAQHCIPGSLASRRHGKCLADIERAPLNFPSPPSHVMSFTVSVQTAKGREQVKIPKLSLDENRLRRERSRMRSKSARLLEVAVRERARTDDYLGQDGLAVKRRVLLEAMGDPADNGLGFETVGPVRV